MALDRRQFLSRTGAIAAGGLLAGGPFAGLAAAPAAAATAPARGAVPAHKRLRAVPDLRDGVVRLHLPKGFAYRSFHDTESGATTTDGTPIPGRHDGMAAFAGARGSVVLVRNHEINGTGAPISTSAPLYDSKARGGTTSVQVTATGEVQASKVSLAGTMMNCSGGAMPWGSWLTCEETVNGTQNGFARDHGYVFEVPADGVVVDDPQPHRAMGRFAHEAVAIDPATGIVYETEDSGNTSGFYRFLPNDRSDLSKGGVLQMLAVKEQPRFLTYRGVSDRVGNPMPVEWVTIPDPDPASITTESVFDQGSAQGGAAFARLEGCWYDGGSIFFNATSGGDVGAGQVWEYRPRGRSGGQLVLLFESPSPELLDSPDNLTVSPRGGLVLCEDGDGEQFVRGLNERGEIFDLAKNTIGGDNEFAGACFSPDGDVMFVNVQTPGVSFAIRGPWEQGAL